MKICHPNPEPKDMIHTSGYMQVVPNSAKPMPYDIEKLAYFVWLAMDKPEGRSEAIWTETEKYLTNLANAESFPYGEFVMRLREL